MDEKFKLSEKYSSNVKSFGIKLHGKNMCPLSYSKIHLAMKKIVYECEMLAGNSAVSTDASCVVGACVLPYFMYTLLFRAMSLSSV